MKPSSPKTHPRVRRLAQAGLAAALLLTTLATARAQTLILQMESIIPEGTGTYPAAWIENPQIQSWGEPSILSITSPQMTEVAVGPLWYGFSMGVTAFFPPSPPGQYNVVATSSGAAWGARQLAAGANDVSLAGYLLLRGATLQELSVTKPMTVVGLTGITADRYHVAYGGTVTFTAAMTPQNAFQFIYWDVGGTFYNQGGGGTYQWQATRGGRAQTNGVVAVTAMCGTKTISVPITVYQLTGATVSSPLVAAGEALTFTAQLDPPGGSPPPIEWFVNGVSQGTVAGNSFSISTNQPGYYTVTARLGTAEAYASGTVVGIGSVKLSGPDTGNVESIPNGTQYIYQGDAYTFTAYPTPDGAPWPAGWPTWTIDGTVTTGPTASHTFGTVSTNATNYKTAVAACGTSSATIQTVVYKCDLTAGPEYDFPNRSYSRFGLGEIVNITNTITPAGLTMGTLGLEWRTEFPFPASFTSNAIPVSGGPVPSGSAAAATFSASAPASMTPSVPLATAKISDVGIPGSYRVFVVGNVNNIVRASYSAPYIPFNVRYEALTVPFIDPADGRVWGTNIWHIQNSVSAGRYLLWFMEPDDVAWSYIKVREGGGNYVYTNFCAFFPNPPTHRIGPHHDVARNGGKWQVQSIDTCSYGEYYPDPGSGRPLGTGGEVSLFLEIECSTNPADQSSWKFLTGVPFKATVNAAGDVEVTKGNVTFSTKFGDPGKHYNDP